MRKRQKNLDATQLNLFMEEPPPQAPRLSPQAPRLSQTFKPRELSLAEMTAKRDAYLAWGKRHGYPSFQFADPRMAWTEKNHEIIQPEGEKAWRQTLLTQPMDWIETAMRWLTEEMGDAHTLVAIHKGRGDMLLHYAMHNHYPQLCGQVDGQSYTFMPGKEAWELTAYRVDRAIIEHAISVLAMMLEEKKAQSPAAEGGPTDLESLLRYTRDGLKFHSTQDDARREWLRAWARNRGYKGFSWQSYGKYDGFTTHHIEDGEDRWTRLLDNGGSFDIYCCYVQARGASLKLFLEDGARRGERRDAKLIHEGKEVEA